MIHLINKVCSCEYCTMLDVMFGDPLLNDWEKKFIDSVARQGGERDYSKKQKAAITKTFVKQKHKWKRPA